MDENSINEDSRYQALTTFQRTASILSRHKLAYQKKIAEADDKYKRICRKIAALKNPFLITEHAIVRYVQRVGSISKSTIEKRILPSEMRELIEQNGYADGRYWAKSHGIVLNKCIVETVLENKNGYVGFNKY